MKPRRPRHHLKAKAEHSIRVKAWRLSQTGASDRDVGNACGYSASWVRALRLAVEAGKEPEVAADAITTSADADPPARAKGPPGMRMPAEQVYVGRAGGVSAAERGGGPTSPAPATGEIDISAKTQLQKLIRQAEKTSALQDLAQADGNSSAAQKYGRDLADMSKLIARLQKDSKEEIGGVLLTPEVIAAADLELDALLLRQAQWGGPHCARCGRELRIAAAEKEGPKQP